MPGLRRSDLVDIDFVDKTELGSSGSGDTFMSSVVVLSTTSSTKRVVVSGYNLSDYDEPTEVGDTLVLSGTSGGAADGTFTVAALISSATLEVTQTIADSTGGVATFRHPPGGKRVGFNPNGSSLTALNVQDAIVQLANMSAPSASLSNTDFLLENEPPTPNNVYELTTSGQTVTQERWKRTADFTLLKSIDYTYAGNKVSTSVHKVYASDGSTIIGQFTRSYIYTGGSISKVSGTRDV